MTLARWPVVAASVVLAISAGFLGSWGSGFIRISPYSAAGFIVLAAGVMGAVMLLLARSLAAADARRTAIEHQLRRAADLTAGLARAVTVEDVARTAIELGLPALGADAGSVYLLEPEHARLRQLALAGYAPAQREWYETISLDQNTPLSDAARRSETVIVLSREEFRARYPHLGEPSAETRSWVALPIEGRERMLGVLGLSFRVRTFRPESLARLQNLAWQCGQALDRALLFEEVKSARDVARAADRAKDSFLAVLGHELRNPLAPITHALELMRARDPKASRERAVIERQVRHVSHLVDDLLDVSRIAQGKVVLAREVVDVADVARDAVEHVRPLIDERRHRLTMTFDTDLYVDGDRARLVQVISNLLHNAARYTPAGGDLTLATERDGDDVVITVGDNGVGIDAALLPSLFEPFVQGERLLERATGGLGLGLSIAHDLLALHGGSIEAWSDGEGRGATFRVRLPAAPRPRNSAPALPAAMRPDRHGRRVLIVDDNEDAAELMAESLSHAGHATRVAFDGERALEVVNEFDPDYVILDIGLPRIDGYEVARRLRALDAEQHRHRVLVALTGFGQAEDVKRALDAGFDRHLVKPMPIKVALEIIATTPDHASGTTTSPA